jgi:hypothetical protein
MRGRPKADLGFSAAAGLNSGQSNRKRNYVVTYKVSDARGNRS